MRHDEFAAIESERRQLILGIVCLDAGVKDRSRLIATGGGLQVESTHHFVDVADGKTLSIRKDDDRIGKPGDFRDGVTYIHDRNVELIAQALDIVEYFG